MSSDRLKIRSTGKLLAFERSAEYHIAQGKRKEAFGDLPGAMLCYHRALKARPYDPDTVLTTASLLTKMQRFEEANRLYIMNLANKEYRAKSYIGLAFNLINMGCFSLAEEYLSMCLEEDEDKELYQRVMFLTDIVKKYGADEPSISQDMDGVSRSDLVQIQDFIQNGDSNMAISLLKDISYKNPDHIGIKNNLAVMLFEAKRLDEAIEQVRDIARTIPDSILIQCNLVMFLTAAGKTSEAYDILKELSARTPDDIHEALQLAILLGENGFTGDALRIYNRLYSELPYSPPVCHGLALCCFHKGDYGVAIKHYNKLLKIDPLDSVALYYRRICSDALIGKKTTFRFKGSYSVPVVEAVRRLSLLKEMLDKENDYIASIWDEDNDLESVLRWTLMTQSPQIQKSAVILLGRIGGARAEYLLRECLADFSQPDELKLVIFSVLDTIGARMPYISCISGRPVSAPEPALSKVPDSLPYPYYAILEGLLDGLRDRRGGTVTDMAAELVLKFYGALDDYPYLNQDKRAALSAAFEYEACRRLDIEVTPEEVAQIRNVTVRRIKNALKTIKRSMEG